MQTELKKSPNAIRIPKQSLKCESVVKYAVIIKDAQNYHDKDKNDTPLRPPEAC